MHNDAPGLNRPGQHQSQARHQSKVFAAPARHEMGGGGGGGGGVTFAMESTREGW